MVNKAVNFITICLHFISGSIFCDSSHQAQSAARRLLDSASQLGFATTTHTFLQFSCNPYKYLVKKIQWSRKSCKMRSILVWPPAKLKKKQETFCSRIFKVTDVILKLKRGKIKEKHCIFFAEVSLVLPFPYFSIASTSYHVLHQNGVQRARYDTLHSARQWLCVVYFSREKCSLVEGSLYDRRWWG